MHKATPTPDGTMRPMRTPAFDPTPYPRTYRPLLTVRLALCAVAALCILGAIVTPLKSNQPGASVLLNDAGLLVAAVLASFFAAVFLRTRVVLGASWIEVRTPWTTRRVERSQILTVQRRLDVARKTPASTGEKALRALAPRRPPDWQFRLRTTQYPRPFGPLAPLPIDDAYRAWFAGLTNEAQLAVGAWRARMLDDDRLGATRPERLARLQQAQGVGFALVMVATALMVWLVVDAHPPTWAIFVTAALPLLAIALCARSHGLYSLVTLKGLRAGGATDLGALLWCPLVALGIRAWTDATLIDGHDTLLATSLVIGTILAALARSACIELRQSPVSAAGTGLLCWALAAATLDVADVHVDTAPSTGTLVAIQGRSKTSGRSPNYYLRLASVPVGVRSRQVKVRDAVWQATADSAQACVIVHPGWLRMRWFDVQAGKACSH